MLQTGCTMALFGSKKVNDSAKGGKSSPVFRYTHMPEFFPRVRRLLGKFGHFAFLLALIYRSARLLPEGHPMLNSANIGRFGIRDVIATAANGLVVKRENADQVLIFGAVMMAVLLIAVQTILIAMYAFMGQANAADIFGLTNTQMQSDVVMQFLRQVFGVADIFGSLGGDAAPQPGLHAILGFYSSAMMIIAVLIVVYYVVTVVGESAQSGTPFGRRFNGLWAPIRLVLALGLLVPLGSGLNAGQYLTLYIAKFGSALASNAWSTYTKSFDNPDALMSNVRAPAMSAIGNAIFTAEVCKAAYNLTDEGISKPVKVRIDNGHSSQIATLTASDFDFAKANNQNATKLTYVYAAMSDSRTDRAEPTCGSFEMEILATSASSSNDKIKLGNEAARKLRNAYIQAISGMITDMATPASQLAKKAVVGDSWFSSSSVTIADVAPSVASAINNAQTKMNTAIGAVSWSGSNSNVKSNMKTDAETRGWGTAGIYYLEMAKVTQMVLDAVGRGYPTPVMGPDGRQLMSLKSDGWFDWLGLSSPDKDVRAAIALANDALSEASKGLTVAPTALNAGKMKEQSFGGQVTITKPFLWVASWLFGDAFISLVDKPEMNPMGRLIEGGAFIMERVELMTYLYLMSNTGVITASIIGAVAGAAQASATAAPAYAMMGALGGAVISAFFSSLGGVFWFLLTLGLMLGVVLFYVMPLMPFMYFFFSVVNWVIEVAEAFVSMPLFALAHLRIDGDGLPGQTAYQGWLLLFGILVRPILIVLGLIVGLLIFNAGSYYLNQIFKYAVFAYNPDASNAAGALSFENMSGFGLIVYTILYVYLVYMLANTSFKLIDEIPDKLLRWVGGGQSFTGQNPVQIEGMKNMLGAGYLALQSGNSALMPRFSSMSRRAEGAVTGGATSFMKRDNGATKTE